ncbi:Uncharacterised protein [Cedecea lapagei]|uniref:Uncharacterized protein n=1 Tax=Cedecea lapagei TaxID=158823 RepID=A0A3S4KWH2_9ENTR|nr:Uncharacterised protein [Cedecea lapagei]
MGHAGKKRPFASFSLQNIDIIDSLPGFTSLPAFCVGKNAGQGGDIGGFADDGAIFQRAR